MATPPEFSPASRPTRADPLWKGGIVLVLLASIVASLRWGAPQILLDLIARGAASHALRLGMLTSAGALVYGLVSFYHALRYRPVPSPDDDGLPTCTVIVPAFNEGAMVRVSLLSALASDYPADKLQVIAVDDGSTDDTWEHILAVARRHPTRLQVVRQPRNQGKREALRAGFLRARSEIVVTVDSDSKLEPDALRAAVAPLVADPEVGAVAGKVVVLNRYESLLTRLLAARFYLTFDFARAVQSRFGAVLCCPGALTAYRRAAVMRVLDRWSAQTFLGSPCTIGEDRALTTWLLREHYRSVYQATAIVHTIVPATMRGLVRMLIRWERGNVRENLVMLPILFTRWRTKDRLWPTLDVILDLAQFPLGAFMTGAAIVQLAAAPAALLGMLATLGLLALTQSLYCLRSERGTDFVYNVGYALLATIGLAWVFPYSCFTLRNGAWLTR